MFIGTATMILAFHATPETKTDLSCRELEIRRKSTVLLSVMKMMCECALLVIAPAAFVKVWAFTSLDQHVGSHGIVFGEGTAMVEPRPISTKLRFLAANLQRLLFLDFHDARIEQFPLPF